MMSDDVNEVVRLMGDEMKSRSDHEQLKSQRKRKSALDPYRYEIILRRMAGKSYRQIANFIVSTYKIKTDHTLVYDFCKRCFSE